MIWSRYVRASLAAALAACALVALWLNSKCWGAGSTGCTYWGFSRANQGAHGKGRSGGSPPPTAIAIPTPGEEDMGDQLGGTADTATAAAAAAVEAQEGATTRNRAIAVVFSDVGDVLVLERALALWNSLKNVFPPEHGDEVFAIVPRYRALQLEAPLKEIGYRVLPRDSPAPAWRTSGRFVQQALTAAASSGRWNLLALEALSLTEFEEVVVLDQKMIIFRSERSQQQAQDSPSREGREGGIDNGGLSSMLPPPWKSLLPPLPTEGGESWSVAFAESRADSSLDLVGVKMLPKALREFVSRRHTALMVVRPSAELYNRMANILCQGDAIMDAAYPDVASPHGESIRSRTLESRAPTTPLLHLAVALSSSSSEGAPLIPLEAYGEGRLAMAWCPLEPGEEIIANQKEGEGDRNQDRTLVEHLPERTSEAMRYRGRIDSTPGSFGTEAFSIKDGQIPERGLEEQSPPRPKGKGSAVRNRGQFEAIPDSSDSVASAVPTTARVRGREETALKSHHPSPFSFEGFHSREAFSVRPLGKGSKVVHGVKRGIGDVISEASSTHHKTASAVAGGEPREVAQGSSAQGGVTTSREWRESIETTALVAAAPTVKQEEEKPGSRLTHGVKHGGGVRDELTTRWGRSWSAWLRRRLRWTARTENERGLEGENDPGRVIHFAWIPGDPCSCAEEEGVVGEGCRAWLETRATPLTPNAEAPPDARSACREGAFASPRSVPRPVSASVLREIEFATATAGASVSAVGRNVDGDEEGGGIEQAGVDTLSPLPSPPPPPLWQETARHTTAAVVTAQDLNSFQHFWLINEDKKLLMVAIPKVACSQIHALFLRMQGSKKWNSSVLAEIHYHKDQSKYTMRTVEGMTPQKASDILNDPSWTKGVFLRDPADRLLSCFLDKIVHRRSYSVNILKARDILSFEMFVNLLSKDARERYGEEFPGPQLGISQRSNPHWKPQLYFRLDKFLPYFDFIGDFNHVERHSEELLRRAGLWEEFGASGWGPEGKSAFFQRSTVQGHATGSESAKSLYYSRPLLSSVRDSYGPTDYLMLAELGWWNETAFP